MYDVVTSMYVKLAEIISLTKLSTLHRFCNLLMEVDCMNIYYLVDIGVIQQLRGQEGGEGGLAKSPRLSTQGKGECLWMST